MFGLFKLPKNIKKKKKTIQFRYKLIYIFFYYCKNNKIINYMNFIPVIGTRVLTVYNNNIECKDINKVIFFFYIST